GLDPEVAERCLQRSRFLVDLAVRHPPIPKNKALSGGVLRRPFGEELG
ncbi:MAG: hypothetical protein IIA44_12990, partial [Acidobacteria bacterium]|nr:hypothetical protein [Acidobacteriota bacterium]